MAQVRRLIILDLVQRETQRPHAIFAVPRYATMNTWSIQGFASLPRGPAGLAR